MFLDSRSNPAKYKFHFCAKLFHTDIEATRRDLYKLKTFGKEKRGLSFGTDIWMFCWHIFVAAMNNMRDGMVYVYPSSTCVGNYNLMRLSKYICNFAIFFSKTKLNLHAHNSSFHLICSITWQNTKATVNYVTQNSVEYKSKSTGNENCMGKFKLTVSFNKK